MKRILLLMLLMCSVSAWAQDVIVKRDGSAVVCRIINVSSLEIVYKAWTDLQGPNLVMSVADAASITYENGEKKVFDNATKEAKANVVAPLPQMQNSEGKQTVSDDALLKMAGKPEMTALEIQKKVKRLKRIGYIGGPALILGGIGIVLGFTDSGYISENQIGGIIPGAMIITAGVAMIPACALRAYKLHKRDSHYSVQTAPFYQQEFTLKNGTTLCPSINMLKDNTRHNPTLGIGLSYNF